MGISSYFISDGPRHQHALYWEILVSLTGFTLPSRMVKLTLQSVISVGIFFFVCVLSYLLFRNMARFTWAYYVIFAVDYAFSYLWVTLILYSCLLKTYQLCRWLTTFIFAAQDYNLNNCKLGSPLGVSCATKKANESFMFITLWGPHYSITLCGDDLRLDSLILLSISSICLTLFLGSPLSPFSTYSFDESRTKDANNPSAMSEHEVREGYQWYYLADTAYWRLLCRPLEVTLGKADISDLRRCHFQLQFWVSLHPRWKLDVGILSSEWWTRCDQNSGCVWLWYLQRKSSPSYRTSVRNSKKTRPLV